MAEEAFLSTGSVFQFLQKKAVWVVYFVVIHISTGIVLIISIYRDSK